VGGVALQVDHLGIVVRDLAAALAFYRDVLGCAVTRPIVREGQGITKAHVSFANMQIELIAPTTPDSPIKDVLEQHNASDFLARHPEGGIHHVCYAVPDLLATRDNLIARGLRMLGSAGVVTGAAGQPISFIDPAATDGVSSSSSRHHWQPVNEL
jgi:methylmalonyl-CoA/ethylmalonyl-CoA epimerase